MKKRSEGGRINYREVERGRSKGEERGDGRRTESKIWREKRQVKRGGGCQDTNRRRRKDTGEEGERKKARREEMNRDE